MKFLKFFNLCCMLLCVMFVHGQSSRISVEEYIKRYQRLAIEEMYRAKIPASITMAQALLESGAGNSELSIKSNNHFGIKCKGNWIGAKVYHDDDTIQECFRAYDSVYQSFKDHSDFLLRQSRYAFLFSLEPHDYKGWSYGLKKAGYATNPLYAEKLIEYIEKHELHKLDLMQVDTAFKTFVAKEIKELNRQEININETFGVIAKEGDSYQRIAVEYDMRMWQLQKYNDLPDNAECHKGDTIYLKPKRNKSFQNIHIVKQGETMRGISQKYAVRLRKIYQRNLMEPGEEPKAGENIYINDTRESKPLVYQTSFSGDFDQPFDYNKLLKEDSSLQKVKPEIEKKSTDGKKDTSIKEIKTKPVQTKEQPTEGKIATKKPVSSQDTLISISINEYREYRRLKVLDSLKNIPKKDIVVNPVRKSEAKSNYIIHIVEAKQTLYSISKLYNVSVEEIKSFNQLQENTLEVGQELKIPQLQKREEVVPTDDKRTSKYTWKKTDKFYIVAKKHDISRRALLRLNNGIDTLELKQGDIIKVPYKVKK